MCQGQARPAPKVSPAATRRPMSRPVASPVRWAVDSEIRRPESFLRKTEAAYPKLSTAPAMATAWRAPGVDAWRFSPRTWSQGIAPVPQSRQW